jgi:hypothetical protein
MREARDTSDGGRGIGDTPLAEIVKPMQWLNRGFPGS